MPVGFAEVSLIAPATGEQLLGLILREVKTCKELRSLVDEQSRKGVAIYTTSCARCAAKCDTL